MSETKPTIHKLTVFPTRYQYPLDLIVEETMRELAARRFKVPGVNVELDVDHDFAKGRPLEQQYFYRIRSDQIFMRFGRMHYSADHTIVDRAAVSTIRYKGKELCFFADTLRTGAMLFIYGGDNLKKDMGWWKRSPSFKMSGRNRMLTYWHAVDKDGWELNSLYSPGFSGLREGESAFVTDDEIYGEFAEALQELLDTIRRVPREAQIVEAEAGEELYEKYESRLGEMYTLCDFDTLSAIRAAQSGRSTLYSSALVPKLRITCGNEYMSKSYPAYIPCQNLKNVGRDLGMNRYMLKFDYAAALLKIKPKYANELFVADQQIYWDTYNKLINSTDEQKARCGGRVNRSTSIVPLSEYDGSYRYPILLSARALDFDEVEVVGEFTP